MTRLAIFREDEFQDEHVLMRATVALGRHPENDIVLNDLTLSRFHARLERRGDAYVVVDLGAQNGVYLNGQKVTGERGLSPGDRIGIGSYVAIFDQAGAAGTRRRSDSQAAENPVVDAAVSFALDEDSLEDLSIDLDMSNAGVEFEMEVDAEEAQAERQSDEAPFFEEVPTAVIESEIETGPRSQTELSALPSTPVMVLLYNGQEVSRHDIEDGGEMIVGRSKSNDVVISLLGLSRRHTRIRREGEQVIVEDLGSQNGTWVNNHRIEGRRRVRHGDLMNYYEYGLLFLEDPSVEISVPAAPFDRTGTDDLDAIETGRQDGISIGQMPQRKGEGAKGAPLADQVENHAHRQMTNRSPVPVLSSEAGEPAVEVDHLLTPEERRTHVEGRRRGPTQRVAGIGNEPSVDENYDPFVGFDLDEISGQHDDYLAEALDEDAPEGAISLEGDALEDDDELKPSHTQILLKKFEEEEAPHFLDELSHDDDASSFSQAPPTGPAHRLKGLGAQLALDKTSAMVLPVGLGDRHAWPSEDELEPALAADERARLVQLEVFLDDKLYTQLPMSQPVVRVGTDARCELALPSAAGLAPWQFTLIPFGEVLVCYRASRDARVMVDDVVIDQAVLSDGDEISLGRVRVRVRIR